MTLLVVYMLPLTAPHLSHLVEAGLLPTKAAYLTEISAVIELLGPNHEPVVIIGGLNAYTTAFAPSVEG